MFCGQANKGSTEACNAKHACRTNEQLVYIYYSEVSFLPHKDNTTIFGIEDSSMPNFALIGAQVGYGTSVLSIMPLIGRVCGITVAISPFKFGNYFDTVG